jgi:REP element-mobilizing transposase RayT
MPPIGYHIVLGMYGFWLPNDPRGSGSSYVGSKRLLAFGAATKVATRHSVAHRSHDRQQRALAKQTLERPPVKLSGRQALAVGTAVGDYCQRRELPVWALAVMPDHLHLVVGYSELNSSTLRSQLKGAASRRLIEQELHSFQSDPPLGKQPPSIFARNGWCVYLKTGEDVRRVIAYVERNPLEQGLPRQRWSCVKPFVYKH